MHSISFRARLGTFIAVAVGVTVALASLASYFAVSHQLFNQVDSSLVTDVQNAPAESHLAQSVDGFLRRDNNSFLQLVTSQRQVIFPGPGNTIIPVSQKQANLATTSGDYNIRTVSYQGIPYRVITEGGYATQGVPVAIQIYRPLADIDHTLGDLKLILLLVTLGGVGVAVGLGYLIGKTTLRPVERLTAAAEHVAATQDLDATIEEQGGDDELARLARSFNSMLTALAQSRQQQMQLISDAGHELRTPLTSLRTNIEVLMRVPDLPEADRTELVADVHAQLEELTTLIGDVVDVAREDERQTDPIEVRFDAIVDRAVERARRRAPNVTFQARLTPGSIRANPALLERAVLNVLDNAAKWSPLNGIVTVWLQRHGQWTLDVRDQGPGIEAEDLPRVFDRFYRAPAARSMAGSGLGLAIVRKVISDHGGTAVASCPPGGGTLIHIELPTVAEHEPDAAPVADDRTEPVSEPGATPSELPAVQHSGVGVSPPVTSATP
jgi:two-component system sensor histidine kinase MprB